MAFGCSPYHRGSSQSFDIAWVWWLTSQNLKNKGSWSLQMSIFAQILGMLSPFSFYHKAKHAHLHLSSGYCNLIKMTISAVLQPSGPCVSYYPSACTLCLLHEKKDGNGERSPCSLLKQIVVGYTQCRKISKFWSKVAKPHDFLQSLVDLTMQVLGSILYLGSTALVDLKISSIPRDNSNCRHVKKTVHLGSTDFD